MGFNGEHCRDSNGQLIPKGSVKLPHSSNTADRTVLDGRLPEFMCTKTYRASVIKADKVRAKLRDVVFSDLLANQRDLVNLLIRSVFKKCSMIWHLSYVCMF